MQNWSVDLKHLKKFPRKYKLWRLIQMLSYGLDGAKVNKREVKANWAKISPQLDPNRRDFLKFLLWGS